MIFPIDNMSRTVEIPLFRGKEVFLSSLQKAVAKKQRVLTKYNHGEGRYNGFVSERKIDLTTLDYKFDPGSHVKIDLTGSIEKKGDAYVLFITASLGDWILNVCRFSLIISVLGLVQLIHQIVNFDPNNFMPIGIVMIVMGLINPIIARVTAPGRINGELAYLYWLANGV